MPLSVGATSKRGTATWRERPRHDSDQPLLREGTLGARSRRGSLPRAGAPSGLPSLCCASRRRRHDSSGPRLGWAGARRVLRDPRGGQRSSSTRAEALPRRPAGQSGNPGDGTRLRRAPRPGGKALDVLRTARPERHRPRLRLHRHSGMAATCAAVRLSLRGADHRSRARRQAGDGRAGRGGGESDLRRGGRAACRRPDLPLRRELHGRRPHLRRACRSGPDATRVRRAAAQPEVLPAGMSAKVDEFRAHPAGAHALRMFREERRLSPARPDPA